MVKKASEKTDEMLAKIAELTNDLQRTRAEFENYRKRADDDLTRARRSGREKAVREILPLLDVIDKAVATLPAELENNSWARGVAGLGKNLDKILKDLNLAKIPAKAGDDFDHNIHSAIQVDEDSVGQREIVAEVLQDGYRLDGEIVRPVLVKVARTDDMAGNAG
ncbi:MAG: nucleotide exchange factor GrpE [Candidatus Nomurabacteria bacterium]|jgi:molecular chaperone GrpE|nr:nucleotide exchange factor GrpE [Candidatus Nomurabacteria bacterium]